jgi:hypothetical protein
VIRILATMFRSSQSASDCDNDALGEFLRGAGHSDVVPEVLLRIL